MLAPGAHASVATPPTVAHLLSSKHAKTNPSSYLYNTSYLSRLKTVYSRYNIIIFAVISAFCPPCMQRHHKASHRAARARQSSYTHRKASSSPPSIGHWLAHNPVEHRVIITTTFYRNSLAHNTLCNGTSSRRHFLTATHGCILYNYASEKKDFTLWPTEVHSEA